MAKKTTGSGDDKPKLPESQARDAVEKLVRDAAAQAGPEVEQMMDEAIRVGKEKAAEAHAAASDNVVDLDAERTKREGLSPFEQQVQAGLRDAFSTYVNEKVVKPGGPTEINVDPQFLQEHGPALLGALVQGFVKAVVPPEIKVELNVPPPPGAAQDAAPKAESKDAPGAPGQQVTMKVDLGGLFRNLMKTPDAAQPPAAQAEPNKDE